MEYIPQKEIEKRHYSTFRYVYITLILIILLIIATAAVLVNQGYKPSVALFESFHIVTHFPQFSFNSVLISLFSIMGAIMGIFIIVTLLSIIYGGELRYELREGKKMRKINQIKNHVIICGANIIGNNVSVKLDAENVAFVIVDDDLKGLNEPRDKDFLVVEGNPLDERVLRTARIDQASVLVAVLEQDGANMLLAALAKKLNPKLKVIAQTNYSKYIEHMEKIGADLVMMPQVLGAFKIADVVKDVMSLDNKDK